MKRGLLESSKTLENDVLRINVKESFYVHHTNCDIKTEYFKLDISVDIPESVTIYSSKALAKKGEPYPIALEVGRHFTSSPLSSVDAKRQRYEYLFS